MTTKFYTRLGVEYTQEAASKFDEYLFGSKDKPQPVLKVVE